MNVELHRKVTVLAKLHNHVKVVWGLEAIDQLQHVRMIKLLHDLRFRDSVPNLVLLDEQRLLHCFHRIELACVSLPDPKDLSERALAQHLQHLEVRELDHLHYWRLDLSKSALLAVN